MDAANTLLLLSAGSNGVQRLPLDSSGTVQRLPMDSCDVLPAPPVDSSTTIQLLPVNPPSAALQLLSGIVPIPGLLVMVDCRLRYQQQQLQRPHSLLLWNPETPQVLHPVSVVYILYPASSTNLPAQRCPTVFHSCLSVSVRLVCRRVNSVCSECRAADPAPRDPLSPHQLIVL
ncbi:hypothetical protein FJT64_007738 [Amphibalanus amphitrite]|uniref:Uncharacterized protein n=1 Tax=Amphibalanus amphitrite TaxID=1232801 RepID=A0A6A4VUZ1_AMPAM|nr:hypothetical protein FJT64_007738 [Amphibalanus amphitrite]